ncbi:MAG: hydroxyacylglutathione hydrolase [Coxiella endosymbiont of Dermacentor nuttalli]
MSHIILAIPALNDNYIWAIVHPKKKNAVVIDPGETKPILDVLEQQDLTLAAILLTHHHWDHTHGISGLLEKYLVPVYGPDEAMIPCCDHLIKGGDYLTLSSLELTFSILSIPGHTLSHIAYYGHQLVFTGDTLFSGGCGRLLEGSSDQLYRSLLKLAALPFNTRVYCGHEYTKKNLEFAKIVDPNNLKLKKRIVETQKKISQNLPILPPNLRLELDTNPFLRCHKKSIQQSVIKYHGHSFADEIAIFAALRQWKDKF